MSGKGLLPVDKASKTMPGVCSILGLDGSSQGTYVR